jgi:sortase A
LQRFWESQKSESEAGIGNTSRADPREPDFRLWSEKRIAAYKTSLASRVPFPLAVLKIPAIRLEVPVLPGTDDLTLNRAVGHIDGSALPGTGGNVGIAGHRDGFFRGLKDIHVGDVITLATQNDTDHYLVDEILIVSPEDVSVLQPRATSSVTLVTCYPFYFVGSAPERYIVHASIANSSGGVGPGETRHFLEKGGDQER